VPREDGAEVEAGAGSLGAGAGSGKHRRHLVALCGCAPVRVNRASCEMRSVAVLQGRAVVWAEPCFTNLVSVGRKVGLDSNNSFGTLSHLAQNENP